MIAYGWKIDFDKFECWIGKHRYIHNDDGIIVDDKNFPIPNVMPKNIKFIINDTKTQFIVSFKCSTSMTISDVIDISDTDISDARIFAQQFTDFTLGEPRFEALF